MFLSSAERTGAGVGEMIQLTKCLQVELDTKTYFSADDAETGGFLFHQAAYSVSY